MESSGALSNPLGWVQAQLQGGWRRALTIGGVYFLGAGAALMIIYRALPHDAPPRGVSPQAFARGVLLVLLILQAAILVLVGASSVRRAVQRDLTGGMIDSHRLTPMTGWSAVVGYLSGPNIVLLPLTVANWLLSIAVSLFGEFPPLAWTAGLAVILCLALPISAMSLLAGLSSKRPTNVAAILLVLGLTGGTALLFLVPGLGLLLGFFSTWSMLRNVTGTVTFDATILFSLAGQLVLAGIFCVAAARRFVREDVQAFPWPLALMLLAFVAVFGGSGLRVWPEYEGQFIDWDRAEFGVSIQWIATWTVTSLFALFPIAAAAQDSARWERRAALDEALAGRRPTHYALVLVLAATVAIGIMTLSAGDATPLMMKDARTAFLSLVFVLLALLTGGAVLRFVYGLRERVGWIVTLWVVLTWALPPLIDMIRAVYADESGPTQPSWLMGCSPAGAWVLIWYFPHITVLPGLIVQTALALATCGGLAVLRRRKIVRPAT
ncbi:MAG: hypothetical protein HUU22_07680 [Phycisphaerae bacterium]|nr:hypothetical protein [Phycisphaerae bacterium]NUQ45898.1 hypothetical protein [Phycisphaerae bacterium]